jgi:hypothetical protein
VVLPARPNENPGVAGSTMEVFPLVLGLALLGGPGNGREVVGRVDQRDVRERWGKLPTRWRKLRAQIHGDVCSRGYDAERNMFTQFYGSRELARAC